MRYYAALTREGLDALGLRDVDPVRLRKLDAFNNIDDLARVGAAAARDVAPEHCRGFL